MPFEDFNKKNESVFDVSQNKSEIFDRVMIYVADVYNSPKEVLQYSNKSQGIIAWNGSFSFPYYHLSVDCRYKFSVKIKDKKYKTHFAPISCSYPNGQTIAIRNAEGYSNDYAQHWLEDYQKTNSELLEYVKGKKTNKKDDGF